MFSHQNSLSAPLLVGLVEGEAPVFKRDRDCHGVLLSGLLDQHKLHLFELSVRLDEAWQKVSAFLFRPSPDIPGECCDPLLCCVSGLLGLGHFVDKFRPALSWFTKSEFRRVK